MKTIYKYPLEVQDTQELELPHGYELLTIQVQHGKPCLWAVIDTKIRCTDKVEIITKGTNHPLDESPGKYISSYQLEGGDLVFHTFIKGEDNG